MNILNELAKLKENKLVYNQIHPTLDLTIWNYTDEVQYNSLWNELLIKCRGLVTNSLGEIVNDPIPKFFNYSETRGQQVCNFTKPFTVYTKYDGSLIMVFKYQGELIICSRGSFTSDQANWAKEIIERENYQFGEGFTYCFELIHKENRIVVNYGDENKLILLAVRGNSIEDELEYYNSFNIAQTHIININEYNDLKKLSSQFKENEEGYVFKFGSNRCKVKFDEYLRLHKLMTNVSTTAIWECLKNKTDLIEVLKDIPDEYYQKIKEYKAYLEKEYNNSLEECLWLFNHLPKGDRKEKAFFINQLKPKNKAVLFMMLDNKNYESIIWDNLKPKFERL